MPLYRGVHGFQPPIQSVHCRSLPIPYRYSWPSNPPQHCPPISSSVCLNVFLYLTKLSFRGYASSIVMCLVQRDLCIITNSGTSTSLYILYIQYFIVINVHFCASVSVSHPLVMTVECVQEFFFKLKFSMPVFRDNNFAGLVQY